VWCSVKRSKVDRLRLPGTRVPHLELLVTPLRVPLVIQLNCFAHDHDAESSSTFLSHTLRSLGPVMFVLLEGILGCSPKVVYMSTNKPGLYCKVMSLIKVSV
jgi:hypothetical protein